MTDKDLEDRLFTYFWFAMARCVAVVMSSKWSSTYSAVLVRIADKSTAEHGR
jgi:hypothetical protein